MSYKVSNLFWISNPSSGLFLPFCLPFRFFNEVPVFQSVRVEIQTTGKVLQTTAFPPDVFSAVVGIRHKETGGTGCIQGVPACAAGVRETYVPHGPCGSRASCSLRDVSVPSVAFLPGDVQ